MNKETQKAVEELRKGCQCLFLEVNEHIGNDVKQRVESLITAFTAELEALEAKLADCKKQLSEMEDRT